MLRAEVDARAVLADAPTMLRAEVGAQPLGLDGLLELEVERPDAVRVSPSFSTLLVPVSVRSRAFPSQLRTVAHDQQADLTPHSLRQSPSTC